MRTVENKNRHAAVRAAARLSAVLDRRAAVSALCAGLLAGAALYAYFVVNIVQVVVLRGNEQKQVSLLDSRMSGLESSYLSLKSSVTIDVAYAKGFVDVSAPKFIPREPLGRGVAVNNEI